MSTPLAATSRPAENESRYRAVSTAAAPTTPYVMCAIAEASSPPNRAVEADRTAGSAAVPCTVAVPFGPSRRRRGDRWHMDSRSGSSSRTAHWTDPPTFRSAPGVSWEAGDTIPIGRDRDLRVVETRLDEGTDGDPVSVRVGRCWRTALRLAWPRSVTSRATLP